MKSNEEKNKQSTKDNESDRYIPAETRNLVLGRQRYKCANGPGSNLKGLGNYQCKLWQENGINQGSFDCLGYEIDHIKEYSIGGSAKPKNLQALCPECHSVKTKNFMTNNNTTSQLLLHETVNQYKHALGYKPKNDISQYVPNIPYKTEHNASHLNGLYNIQKPIFPLNRPYMNGESFLTYK